jgi:uncharacterized membrane protein YgdD (TMEM256/DUF423 family)
MTWIAIGALYCAVAVLAGAFGTHGLKARLDPGALAQWETAARYLMYGGFGLSAIGLAAPRFASPVSGPATSLAVGTVIFAGTVFALALGSPRWFGAITPLGGLGMIVGFAWLALLAWKS